jgi:hypothetical protein
MSEINLKEYLSKVRALENDIFLVKSIIDSGNQFIRNKTSLIQKSTKDLEDCGEMGTVHDFQNCKYIMNNYCNGEEYSVWTSGNTIEKTLKDKYNILVPKDKIPKKNIIKSLIVSAVIACAIIYFVHIIWLGILLGLFCFGFGYAASSSNLDNTLKFASEHAISSLEKEIASSNLYIDELKTKILNYKTAIDNATNELNNLYNLDIIFPKYRNFLAVNQISEYIDSGRCSELEGANGAYNLYESELRQNIIIDKLETVINQLEQIKQNQFYIYQAMRDTQNAIDNMNVSVVTNTYIDGVRY